MKKISIILLLFMSCSWHKMIATKDFNFINSSKLAKQQTELMDKYLDEKKISRTELKSLKNNLWVKMAATKAPGNLVIRQWCLIDLIQNKPKHRKEITDMVRCLSYNGTLWSEGYSYWTYTREIMDTWMYQFSVVDVIVMVRKIDTNFVKTSYIRNGVQYPAPFGDLTDASLSHMIQASADVVEGIFGFVSVSRYPNGVVYKIKGVPNGMNHHIPKDDVTVTVIGGTPVGFKFYTGHKNKYNSIEEEMADLLDKKRIETIGRCK